MNLHTIDDVGKGIARVPRGTQEPKVDQENERWTRSDLIAAASTLGAVDPIGVDPLAGIGATVHVVER